MLSGAASVVLLAAQQTGCASEDAATTSKSDAGNIGRDAGGDASVMSVCGNSTLESGETCDDGNTVSWDGCSSNCQAEPFYVCTGTGAESCVFSPGDWAQQAYVKASNTGADDNFGHSVSLSGDGKIMAVGAYAESSSATGFGGNQADNGASQAGAVYLFARAGGTWLQQAYIKASNSGAADGFGYSVSLSVDGSTLVVGAPWESSSATGVGGNQADNSAKNAGAVYVFSRGGGTWSQQAYLKASNTDARDWFGYSVSLSADGNALAVGASGESSSALGGDGSQADNSATGAGAVYVFSRGGGTWSQQAYLKASNPDLGDRFGFSTSLSADGNTLAVGALYESSSALGIGGSQADNSATGAGAVYIFSRGGGTWSQQAYLKASNTDADDEFGFSVSLSADGNTLAVGAPDERSSAFGVGGNQADNSAKNAGAVYVFSRGGGTWSQQAYLKASNTDVEDEFGVSVSLSANGSTLAVGAWFEGSSATGVGGNQADNSTRGAGAVYVFARTKNAWSQQSYIKASNTNSYDGFGAPVAISADSSTLAIGASGEGSSAAGVAGSQTDNSAPNAGALYVLNR